jgi:YD repeat-containing protein
MEIIKRVYDVNQRGSVMPGSVMPELVSVMRYDAQNRIVFESSKYNQLDNWTYTYDDFGKLVEKKSLTGTKVGRIVFEYSSGTNQITRESWYDKPVVFHGKLEDGSPIVWEYRYDERGLLIEKVSDHISIDWFDRYTFEYDAEGRMVSEKSFFRNGQVHREERMEYDGSGREVSRRHFHKGNEGSRYLNEYDSDGRLSQIIQQYVDRFTGEYIDEKVRRFLYNGERLVEKQLIDEGDPPYGSAFPSITRYEYEECRGTSPHSPNLYDPEALAQHFGI